MSNYYVDVLLPVATDGVYTYCSAVDIPIGSRVRVPLGRRNVVGICISATDVEPEFKCRDIIDIVDQDMETGEINPLFPRKWIEFLKRLSSYYVTPLGTCLHGVLSTKILGSAQLKVEMDSAEVVDLTLTDAQRDIVDSINIDRYGAHLLHGITGSGKTEIYLELAEKVMQRGKKVLYLVPEITLTTQLIDRIKKRLGVAPSVFHSKLTPKQRERGFWSFAKGDSLIMIGARSALYVPTDDLGLIIIDEEHENTYKQEEAPAYHLRDMSVLYASMLDIPIILGSATPQTESVSNAIEGKYHLHKLDNRIGNAILPTLEIVDVNSVPLVASILAEPIYEALYQTIEAGKQAIIFLNRKGYSTALHCRQCGAIQTCKNCSVALTMYIDGRCVCHYCNEEYTYLVCEECGRSDITTSGVGTEKVEEHIEQMFPRMSTRVDADSIKSMKSLNKALDEFKSKKTNILIGTQLIAKGLHFPDVTMVGILGIDNVLSMPDFRATERAYQLLMQVSGRAGRGEDKGIVYIQTAIPEHPLFHYVQNDPEAFYEYELGRREIFEYPPFAKLARLIFSYSNEGEITGVANLVVSELSRRYKKLHIMGPSPAVISKIKNQYRISAIIRADSNRALSEALSRCISHFDRLKKGTMRLKVDRDPYFFL